VTCTWPLFQHRLEIGTDRLRKLDLHIGAAFGKAMQERRKDAVNGLRRRRHPQDAAVAAPQQLSVLTERAHRAEDRAAILKQLLAFAGEDQTAANAIEQPHAELRFESADLAR